MVPLLGAGAGVVGRAAQRPGRPYLLHQDRGSEGQPPEGRPRVAIAAAKPGKAAPRPPALAVA